MNRDGNVELQPGRPAIALATAMIVAVSLLGTAGCEMDHLGDPAVVGRWEHTPVKLPILKRIDLIDEPDVEVPNLTKVMPEDLIAEATDYVMGPGDVVILSVFELLRPGAEMAVQRQIDDLGMFRHPVLGDIRISGMTARESEKYVQDLVARKGMVRDAEVNALVVQGQQNTYSVIGPPNRFGPRSGTYLIRGPDFRLLDATALAGGVSGLVKNIYVMRKARTDPKGDAADADAPATPDPTSSEILLKALDESPEPAKSPGSESPGDAAHPALESSLDGGMGSGWAEIDGKWVKVPAPAATGDGGDEDDMLATTMGGGDLPEVVQRVIEIPYHLLRQGDLRYNVVIRPGDIIRVPDQEAGSVFIFGAIGRPGTYGLPGTERLTLKQLVAAAGGFGPVAIPDRVDLVRRIGDDHEATVRLNLRQIFHGNEPDIFLKTDDLINVGTNLPATPWLIVRRGFRMTYGFGFLLDRNFGFDVFGSQNRNN
ncbi:MAG: hypothetical protein CMJ18_20390 [Phycisphaeraceae bacterium]|nr:hypothetical protein [Phycisphaeraceae bacterium]